MLSSLISGIGVLFCVGALVIVALVLLVYRMVTSSSRAVSGSVVDATAEPVADDALDPAAAVYNPGPPGSFNEIPATGITRRGAVVYTTPDEDVSSEYRSDVIDQSDPGDLDDSSPDHPQSGA